MPDQNSAVGATSSPTPSSATQSLSRHTPSIPTSPSPSPSRLRLVQLSTRVPDGWVNPLSGAIAGAASGLVTCPLDVIKTKLQAQGSFRNHHHQAPRSQGAPSAIYQGLFGTARTIIKHDGLRGMYRGLSPMMLGYLPTWAVYMGVYDWAKKTYRPHFDTPWVGQMLAACTAGACSTTVTNPIWVIKTRLMSQVSASAHEGHRTPWHYNGTFDAARKMFASEGIGAFYSGLAPALLGLAHVAIQFPLYEYFKMQFTGVEMGQPMPEDSVGTTSLAISAATFLSKVAASTITYPHEVLRTRLQTQQRGTASSDGMLNRPRYQGIIRACQTIVHEEGWRAFYNGMGTNLVRAVPSAITTMLTFETCKSLVASLQSEARERERHAGL